MSTWTQEWHPMRQHIESMCQAFGSFTTAGRMALIGLLLIIIMAIFAPFITMHEPSAISGRSLEPPGPTHILGTDELGMDIWSQICYGARMSLIIGLAVALISGFGGGILGYWEATWEVAGTGSSCGRSISPWPCPAFPF